MKKKLLFIASLFSGITINAQTWVQQTSGTVSNLTGVSFVDANNGFVCGHFNTVLKTTNGGTNWSTINTATIGTSLTFKDVFFINASTGWLLSDIGIILKTTDAGLTWTPGNSSSLTPNSTWSKMHFSDANNGYISGVASPSVQLAKTTDGGLTWTNVPFTTSVSSISGLQALGTNSVMIAADNKIYYSNSAGTTWTTSSAITPTSSLLGEVKAFNFASAFVTNRTTGNSLVYKSNVYPVWSSSSNGLTNGGYQNIDAFDANNIMIANFSTGFIHKTTDGGANWTQETMPPAIFINDLKYINSNKAWIVGGGGLILAYGSTANNKENLANKELNFYPNPAKNAIYVKLNQNENSATAVVTDVLGKICLSKVIINEDDKIDLSAFNPGVYFLTINGITKKIIKE
jgi:photosystem II stability/assembly factor-like uncharacterized protein